MLGATLRRLAIAAAAVVISACGRDVPVTESRVPHTYRMDSLHPMLQPVTRAHRPYLAPQTGDPERTAVMALRLDKADRFVLAQEPEDGGQLIVVADSAGRIPVFASADEARSYRARVFPADSGGDAEANSIRAQMQALLDGGGPIAVNLDAALEWADDTRSRGIGPPQAALVWDVLTGAGVAPARLQFDPMGMYALTEDFGRRDIDTTTFRIAMTGMKVGGLTSEVRRKGGGADTRSPFPEDSVVWSEGDRSLLREILARGIGELRARLSPEAAQTNVRATWPVSALRDER
jgi:hypothetical protein